MTFYKRFEAIRTEIENNVVFDYIAAHLIQEKVITKDEYRLITAEVLDSIRAKKLVDILISKKDDENLNNFSKVLRKDYNWISQMLDEIIVVGLDETDFVDNDSSSTPISLIRYQNFVNEQIELNSKQNEQTNIKNTAVESKKRRSNGQLVTETEKTEEIDLVDYVKVEAKKCCLIEEVKENSRLKRLCQVITPEMMTIVRRNHRAAKGWTGLAHSLGLSSKVHGIRYKVTVYGDEVDICVLNLLQEWVGVEPKTATLEKLLNVLKEEGFQDVADELESKFVQ